MRYNVKDAFLIPNILCYVRILLIPIFTILYVNDYYVPAAVVVAISGITDMLDGLIARKCNMITDLGKLIDPVADKFTQAALLLCLLSRYRMMYIVVAVFFVKELAMCAMGIFSAYKKRKLDGAKWFGKVSTIIQFVTMIVLFAFPSIDEKAATLMLSVVLLFLMLAFIMYINEYIMLNQKKGRAVSDK